MREPGESEGPAGAGSTEVVDRLKAGEAAATGAFLRSWIAPVERYCRTVCEPGLVAEAIDVTFADFFEKLRTYPIEDAHLGPALIRSTRLTAGEAALLDEDLPAAADSEGVGFECALTPLLLAGSPSAPSGIAVLGRMGEHLAVCQRCQACEQRFLLAEETFPRSGDPELGRRMLDALLGRSSGTSVNVAPVRRPSEASGPDDDLSAAKQRLLRCLSASEFPLGELVLNMHDALHRGS